MFCVWIEAVRPNGESFASAIGLVEIPDAVQAGNRAEQLAARDLVVGPDVLDDRRRHEISVAVCRPGQPLAAGEHDRARILRSRDGGEHVAHLLFVDDRPDSRPRRPCRPSASWSPRPASP